MLNPEFADDDVMYTAVNILPGIRLVVPATQNNSHSEQFKVCLWKFN